MKVNLKGMTNEQLEAHVAWLEREKAADNLTLVAEPGLEIPETEVRARVATFKQRKSLSQLTESEKLEGVDGEFEFTIKDKNTGEIVVNHFFTDVEDIPLFVDGISAGISIIAKERRSVN